jgi:energy-coupling factor transport system permease protein
MSLLEGLRFTRGDSILHRLDPRIKFLITINFFIASILFLDLLPLLLLFIIQIPIVYVAKIGREWLKTLKGGSVLAIIIFCSNIISFYFFQGSQLSWSMIEYSLSLTTRFLVLITSFSLFFLTTSPDKLSLALEKAKIPYEFNFAFITAIRFVPVLADEAQTIMDAQRSRGLELDKGNFITRIKNYIPILLPLIISSIRRSLELAEAMESRAFGSTEFRTNLYELKFEKNDYLGLVLTLIVITLIIYIKLYITPFPKLLGDGLIFK